MDVTAELEQARKAHRQEAWAEALEGFTAVDAVTPLGIDDLERLGETAQVLGRGTEAAQAMQRAYQCHVDAGEINDALRCAYWLFDILVFRGEFAHAGGWLARAQRRAESEPDCPGHGYLLIPEAERLDRAGDYPAAYAAATRAAELGRQGEDADLVTVATHIQGRVRIKQDRLGEGLALLDEAMLAITAGETTPRVTGWIYCSTIATCHEVHEVRRAREWTTALNLWCDDRPQFTGAYSGICRVHRSELLQLGGEWPDAVREAELACRYLTQGYGEIVAGMAFHQLGELQRLRGELSQAEQSYRRASEYGWETQPGCALLWLAQGKVDSAVAAIRRALGESSDRLTRSRLLPAYVEIMVTANDLVAAREAATELAEIADAYRTPALDARAGQSRGTVLLADGDPESALPALRQAWRLWRDLDAPYEAARTRVMVGLACRDLHDEDTAVMEWDAARQVFEQLGAAPELSRVAALTDRQPTREPSGLSPREIEVLRLVAAGKTNHAIATELFLSEKTVARHLSNIFTKLGVGSRTAAAGYAFEHGLAGPAT
ncbi:MAG: LuxR C-terminal-related transcriptional regulator [Micromonosporaceae bacterium]